MNEARLGPVSAVLLIVRLTSLARNMERKWLKAPGLEEPRYWRTKAAGKLAPFVGSTEPALKVAATTKTAAPRRLNDQPRGGRYKRGLGVPEDNAQENFTYPGDGRQTGPTARTRSG